MKNKLLSGNEEFLLSLERNTHNKELLQELANGQKPYALVVTCSDSRVVPEILFNKFLGELFVIRTAGNVINEGELASIEYGICHLHIPLVIVLGHTHCGAIHAAIHKEKGSYLDPILKRIQKNIGDQTNEVVASKTNAIKECEFIKSKFASYEGDIFPMLYNIEDGTVSIIENA